MSPRKLRSITAEDLYKFELLSEVRISPDGENLVYVQQRVDKEKEKKYTNLWVVSVRGGEPQQFTQGDHNDSHPRWSPDGKQIAFLSDRGDKDKPSQVYLIPFTGGEARPISKIEGKIGSFSWSPNGKSLLLSVRKNDPETIEREKDDQKKKLGVIRRHYERVFYKLDGEGYLPLERWHIWKLDVRSGEAKQLTDHEIYDELEPAWSPDGKWIVFTSNRSENPDFTRDAYDIYMISANGGDFRKIETPMGRKAFPSYSPDGKFIAYYSAEGDGEWYKNQSLWVVPADGSAKPRNLTEKYDIHVSPDTINDMGSPEWIPPTWSPDSARLYFQVAQHGNSMLMSIGRDGEELSTVIGEGGVVSSYSFDNTFHRLAYLYGKMDDPCQIYVREVENGPERLITKVNQFLLHGIDLGEIEEVWFKGPNGDELQGWILKPPGFDPAKKYPSILEIHGGPLTQYGNFFMHEFYYLAAHGYVVYFSNPRGGRGYGEEHAKAIWGGWGKDDYEDLMAWTDLIAEKSYIDPERMGVTGGSYGGYMTVWIIGHTDRFKAAVAQRCVSNLVSMWGSSDLNWIFQQTLNDKPPFEDLEKFWEHSPIKYIGNAHTPTLVIHSENDLRCPIEQGEQVFVALKRLGVDSEMVRFPDEFHGLSRTGRTDRRIARLNHIVRWFDKYLKNGNAV